MRTEARQGLQVLRRVRDFLAATDVKPVSGSVGRQVEELSRLIERLAAHAVEQRASDREFHALASAAQDQVHAIRRDYMRPVARLGKLLFPKDRGARRSLVATRTRNYEGVIADAMALAERAVQHKEQFVAAGFAEDFAERFKMAAEEVRKLVDAKSVQFGRRSAATAGIAQELARGRDVVRLLDAMVAPQLEGTPDRLAEWHTLARFVPVTPEAEAPATPPAPQPPTSSIPEAHAA